MISFFETINIEDVGAIFFTFFVIIFIAVIIGIASKAKRIEQDKAEKARLERGKSDLERRTGYLESLKKKLDERKAGITPMKSTIDISKFEDAHDHYATDYETYSPIEGSLGADSAEGCAELNGIRLIVNDTNFEGENSHTEMEIEGEKLLMTMIMGELLENPKFKNKSKTR